MPLTKPNDYPKAGGVDPKDENHGFFDRKPPVKVYFKPFTQKIIEKNLWVEILAILMVFFAGAGELLGRSLSSGFYFAMGCLITVLIFRFINVENETHLKQITPPKLEELKETPDAK